jgi:propanol-preferring alcohol dehydrogenase
VKPRLPIILGHEGVGRVAAVGLDVMAVKPGDRVGVPWLASACGRCRFCVTGWETLCLRQKNAGYTVDGAWAEYQLVSAAYVVPLPAAVDDVQCAPILCAGVTTYKGLRQTEAKPGDWVVISGVGGTGHIAVQYAKAMGFHVVAVDVDEAKLALAGTLGAEVVINAAAESAAARIQRTIGGAHAVVVTAVSLDAVAQALACLRRGGTCVLTGIPPGHFPVSAFDLVVKGLTLRGSIVGTRQDLREALGFVEEGKIRPAVETRRLEDINAVLDDLRAGRLRGRAVLQLD